MGTAKAGLSRIYRYLRRVDCLPPLTSLCSDKANDSQIMSGRITTTRPASKCEPLMCPGNAFIVEKVFLSCRACPPQMRLSVTSVAIDNPTLKTLDVKCCME